VKIEIKTMEEELVAEATSGLSQGILLACVFTVLYSELFNTFWGLGL
jgi:hypothetical protein